MKKIILIPLLFSLVSLCGCSMLAFAPMEGAEVVKSTFPEKLSNKATKEQQEEVKNQVMKLLEEEYKQPFKLESFSYKYETHASSNSLPTTYSKYGTYYFKAEAKNNPIIVLDFGFNDKKESIKDLIDSFKKNQLSGLYCGLGLVNHYVKSKRTLNDKLTQQEIKANKFCDSRDQKAKYDNAWTR